MELLNYETSTGQTDRSNRVRESLSPRRAVFAALMLSLYAVKSGNPNLETTKTQKWRARQKRRPRGAQAKIRYGPVVNQDE